MKKAALLVRDLPHYRHNAFKCGLIKHGFRVTNEPDMRPGAQDVLVIWNRHGHFDAFARRYETAGATVLVAENGYVGHDSSNHHFFALALDHHNGAGRFPVGDGSRWRNLNIEIKPWRDGGNHIVVCAQRGIGPRGVAMPRDWAQNTMIRLGKLKLYARLRPHPGRARVPLEPDLDAARVVVTWGSSAALKALLYGVPVIAEMPRWIGAGAASAALTDAVHPLKPDRLPMFERLAWAQWSAAEIESGLAFDHLLALNTGGS